MCTHQLIPDIFIMSLQATLLFQISELSPRFKLDDSRKSLQCQESLAFCFHPASRELTTLHEQQHSQFLFFLGWCLLLSLVWSSGEFMRDLNKVRQIFVKTLILSSKSERPCHWLGFTSQTMEELKGYKMKMSRTGTNYLFPNNLAFGNCYLENKFIAAYL